jgi:hypothetical protein
MYWFAWRGVARRYGDLIGCTQRMLANGWGEPTTSYKSTT